jgi:ribosomal protein S4
MSIISKKIKNYDYKKINIFLNKLKQKVIQKKLKNKKIKFYLPSILKLRSKTHQKLRDYFRKNLIEYKKIKISYGLYKTYILKNFFKKQLKNKKNKYCFLLENEICLLLERRIDVLLYRSNLLNSVNEVKQVINHGKIYINGLKINNFSINLKKGEQISIDKKFKKILKKNIKNQLNFRLLNLSKSFLYELNWISLNLVFIKLRTYLPKNLFIFTSLINWNTIISNLKSN